MVGIYRMISPSGKIYIGQSWDISTRKSCYKTKNENGQTKLFNSLLKYGFENHNFTVIHELPEDTTQDVLDIYEIFYMDQYKECGIELMNIKNGGSYGKHSQETKDKISKINRGRKRPDLVDRNKNMVFSEETREKMRLAKLGKKREPLTEEVKQKISQSNLGKKMDESFKEKARKRQTGKVLSEETKKRMSEAQSKRQLLIKHKINI